VNEASFDFSGSAVLVTGGTSGIGHAIACAFAGAGADVTITGTRAAAADYDVDLTRFAYAQLELTDPESIDRVTARTGRLDVLVNNGGALMPGGGDEWQPQTFVETLHINLAGAMRLTTGLRDVLAASAAPGGASVVNLVSMSAFRAVPIVPGYGAAKAGLLALTRNLAVAWVSDGIRVNAVAPGLIDTPMTAPMASFPQLIAEELRHVPMGRMGTPDEVAAAVCYLSSRAASYVTGTVLAVDGGYLAL
jgi:3-oxoacyl-[acyl-carrier protein] reductase